MLSCSTHSHAAMQPCKHRATAGSAETDNRAAHRADALGRGYFCAWVLISTIARQM